VFRVCDPCGGSAGFIVTAMRETRKHVSKLLGLSEKQRALLLEEIFAEGFVGCDNSPNMVLLARINMALHGDPNARFFRVENSLTTDHLVPETYDLIDRTSKKYKVPIKVYLPEAKDVEEMVASKGINLFFDSIENRKLCCSIRKLKPLARAIEGLDAWITGLRKDQSVTRNHLKTIEWDDNNGLLKINPLINWSEQDVWDYIKLKNIPVSPLHKKGFSSIGCQPCTRAIEEGEDVRAGRWWWENPDTKECGLHQK
jgi:phosphoadenosine phosphosulfate reductase